MISEYHRPTDIKEALRLLEREGITTVPLAGGTMVNRPSPEQVAVVDLQALGLDQFSRHGNMLSLGAMFTLQNLLGIDGLMPSLAEAVRLEANYNLRQVATVAGTLVAADGRSAYATAMLALDADLILLPGKEHIRVGNLLPVRSERLRHRLITEIAIPTSVRLTFETISRTPDDLPIVCAAVAQWHSGRTRVTLGGHGKSPLLAMDGPEAQGAVESAKSAYLNAGDQWASAKYRCEMAGVLVQRCLEGLDVG
jgi:CO/xanthine dehydrogenase FAD-binding subunit